MKKYSSKKCHKGKTAYRTPSEFRYKAIKKVKSGKIQGQEMNMRENKNLDSRFRGNDK